MTSSIMHSCDESDDSLRITSVEVEVEVEVEVLLCGSCKTYLIGKLTLKMLHSGIDRNDRTDDFL